MFWSTEDDGWLMIINFKDEESAALHAEIHPDLIVFEADLVTNGL